MKDSPQSAKHRRYDAAFRAEALRLASESRSTQAATRALHIDPKRLHKWQKEGLTPVAAARGAELDPATAAELRQLRTANRRQAQELKILKKPSPSFRRHRTNEPLPFHRSAARPLPRTAALPASGGAGQQLLRMTTSSLPKGSTARASLGNGAGQGVWGA